MDIPHSPYVTKTHHQTNKMTTKNATKQDNVNKIIICDMCSKSYPDINEFRRHTNSHSLHPLLNTTTRNMAVKSTKSPNNPQPKITETKLSNKKVKHSDHTEISFDKSNLPQGSLKKNQLNKSNETHSSKVKERLLFVNEKEVNEFLFPKQTNTFAFKSTRPAVNLQQSLGED